MSQLVETITNAWKDAMKSGDSTRKDTLSALRAAIKKAEIDARTTGELDDTARQAVIDKEAKKRREAIEEYTKVGRVDLADIEKSELDIIAEFLPEQLSDDELLTIVRDSVAQVGA
ncbi:GatB/YqeY domain-containing protein, partial [bacterium]